MSIYRPNAIVETPDHRRATTCYNGPDGVGVKYGEHEFPLDNFPEPDEIFKSPEKELRLIRAGSWGKELP